MEKDIMNMQVLQTIRVILWAVKPHDPTFPGPDSTQPVMLTVDFLESGRLGASPLFLPTWSSVLGISFSLHYPEDRAST